MDCERLIIQHGKSVPNPAYVSPDPAEESKYIKDHNEKAMLNPFYSKVKKQKDRPKPAAGVPPEAADPAPAGASQVGVTFENMKQIEDLTDDNGNQIHEETMSSATLVAEMESKAVFSVYKDGNKNTITGDLEQFLAKYEIPLGIVSKATMVIGQNLVFLMDDSGSMMSKDGVDYHGNTVTRFDEAYDRLLRHLAILVRCAPHSIRVKFINRGDTIKLDIGDNKGKKTTDEWWLEAEAAVKAAFMREPTGSDLTPLTPLVKREIATAERDFKSNKRQTAIYIFNDGRPDGGPAPLVRALAERNLDASCIGLISVSGCDEDVAWMADADELVVKGPDGVLRDSRISQSDDFKSEEREVRQDQGTTVPYNYGIWLIICLFGPWCPILDAYDEEVPFTKHSYSDILGYALPPDEYERYWASFMARTPPKALPGQNQSELNKEFYAKAKFWEGQKDLFAKHPGHASETPPAKAYYEFIKSMK